MGPGQQQHLVFFVRGPYKFPEFIRTQKRDPKTNLRSPTTMWDFWSLRPESPHQVTILFSDRGLPNSFNGPVEDPAFKEPPLPVSGLPTAITTASATMITVSPGRSSG